MTDKKTRIVSNLLSLVLGAVIGAGVYAIKEQITHGGNERVEMEAPSEDVGGGVIFNEPEGNGMTITPSDATNKKVDWSIAFKNGSSAWASGKTITDYVTVTPSADGALTAVVECKQAFGEQIAVKVTSRDNTYAQAEVTVDYVKRITDVSVTMKKNGSPAETVEFSAEGYTYTWECAAVCGTGTVDDTFSYSCTLMTAPSAILGVKANLTGLTADSISSGWSSTETSFVSSKENVLKILKYSGGTTGAMGIAQMNNVRNAFLKYQGELFLYRISATGKYSNGAYQKSYSAGTSTFAVSVTDVNVNNGAIKF